MSQGKTPAGISVSFFTVKTTVKSPVIFSRLRGMGGNEVEKFMRRGRRRFRGRVRDMEVYNFERVKKK